MTGLFSREPKDPQKKKNVQKLREIKKLVKAKNYEKALKSGTEYLQKVPDNHDILFTVGGIYYLKKKYKTAIHYLDLALEIGTYDVDVLLLKAYSHQKLGDAKHIILCCDKIREIDPKNKAVSNLLGQLD